MEVEYDFKVEDNSEQGDTSDDNEPEDAHANET